MRRGPFFVFFVTTFQECGGGVSPSARVSRPGIKLTGGIGSRWQGIYCLEVVPGSPASEEGSVQPSDKILYICGRCTLGMTLEDAVKACEAAPRKVKLKVLR